MAPSVRLPWWPRRPDVVSEVLARDATPQALAERLRRELVGYEARLAEAAAVLEAAQAEERDAGLALLGREVDAAPNDAAPLTPSPGDAGSGAPNDAPQLLDAARTRLGYARKGRELAWLAFTIARTRVNLHAGVLHQLEREQTEVAPANR